MGIVDQNHEIVIVGAGPVGLTLALGLARQGRDVLVIEKNDSTAQHSRAPAIWPGTQEILADLEMINIFLSEGILIDKLEIRDVDRNSTLLALPLEELESATPYPHLLIYLNPKQKKSCYKPCNRSQLLRFASLAKFSNSINISQKLKCIIRVRKKNHTSYAKYVAGCDGANSTVRDHLNASLDGITYKIRAALADVEVSNGIDFHSPRLTTQPRLAIGIRIRQNVWRMILPFAEVEEIPLKQRVEDSAASLFDNRPWQPVWQSEFRLHRRVSSIFANKRIVLAGDAVHINSPVGGQGMNVGIQDASILIRIIIDALNKSKDDPFKEYGRIRQKEIQKGVTDTLTKMLLIGEGQMIRPMLFMVNTLLHLPFLRRRIIKRFAML